MTVPLRPWALIIVPNWELAVQTDDILKIFKYQVPLKCQTMFAGNNFVIERKAMEEGVDILVSTLDWLQWNRDN